MKNAEKPQNTFTQQLSIYTIPLIKTLPSSYSTIFIHQISKITTNYKVTSTQNYQPCYLNSTMPATLVTHSTIITFLTVAKYQHSTMPLD